ncbi:ABC transporter substrate-binding protein [Mycobacterium sp. TNTM28]|uniref:ABC transporter substrate-binding protein n=1 Tax=[Mycobacterium] fortunisiensis TaxID=2600579 RepID=A0ABS6KGE4_9MYCO|nr:ABC transporter substrate-binding protein [[Mycobacterium] fortunisiensis]MBU9762622.1 ABC transporter substrate-binding protein [[Mycobacterium] fortunisiensis]
MTHAAAVIPAAGVVTRRRFLGAAAGLSGAIALGACAPAAPARSTFTALYEGAGSTESIDPGVATMFVDEARIKHVYDGLFEPDSTMTPVPRLATSAEPNADGTRWRITLREARWHDGSPLTAEDVLFTFARILGRQAGPSPYIAASTLSQIDTGGCRAIDRRTVEIALATPSFDLSTLLASYGTRIVKNGTTDFSHPIGTGAFRFETFRPGREFVAARFDDHWGEPPRIEELRVLSAGSDARVAALRAGQADFADNLSPGAVRTLNDAADITVDAAPNSGILYFAMKTDRAPFAHPDVRRALMHLVDRRQLVTVALEGAGEVSDDVFGRGYRYYADDLAPHRHDPGKARDLLRRAGSSDLGFELFVAPVAHGFVEAAHLFREQAAEAGVTVRVVVGSKDTYYTEALTRGDMTMGQSGPLPIPYHFGSRLLSNAPKSYTRWADPEFDGLYHRAQLTRSDERRAALYHTMHEILHDRGGFIFWATTPWHTAHRAGWQGTPAGVPNSLDWARFDGVAPV